MCVCLCVSFGCKFSCIFFKITDKDLDSSSLIVFSSFQMKYFNCTRKELKNSQKSQFV